MEYKPSDLSGDACDAPLLLKVHPALRARRGYQLSASLRNKRRA
jgi:hypothetical protein